MIFVLNCGSQSIKWKVFGLPGQSHKARAGENLMLLKQGSVNVSNLNDYQRILENELSKVKDFEISLIGHRVVHGGDKYIAPVKITDSVLLELEKLNHLAPLHNPYNILGIKACQSVFSEIAQFAVFDTEFFSSLPEYASTYALPEAITKDFGFKRYGFQGTSHEFVAKKAAQIVKKPFNKLKIITCHLGGGASITAIKNGKTVDTSMGFTPMEGLVMVTRSGSIDPGIILELSGKFSVEKTKELLNSESGIKGICGANNMLEVLDMIKKGDKKACPESCRRAKLALDIFVYSIKKYIGSYFAILGGCDILVFTGSIGSGSAKIRNMICPAKAGSRSRRDKFSDILSKTKILAIKTDEELAIAEKICKVKRDLPRITSLHNN